jgi:hypothetical protein
MRTTLTLHRSAPVETLSGFWASTLMSMSGGSASR